MVLWRLWVMTRERLWGESLWRVMLLATQLGGVRAIQQHEIIFVQRDGQSDANLQNNDL